MKRIPKWLTKVETFVILCVGIVLSWIFWAGGALRYIHDWTHRGQFGDLFGGLNTLFTGLAFAGLVFTIILQKAAAQDAEEQKVEDDKLARKRQFENTFFHLLNSLNQVIESTEYTSRPGERSIFVKGRNCYINLCGELNGLLVQETKLRGRERAQKCYREFYEQIGFHFLIGHYYRMLYHIFKFIDRSDLDHDDKIFYAHLVRAQLSSQQLVLLFYNCLADVGSGFKPYVEKYTLFKHLSKKDIQDTSLLELYALSAYGE